MPERLGAVVRPGHDRRDLNLANPRIVGAGSALAVTAAQAAALGRGGSGWLLLRVGRERKRQHRTRSCSGDFAEVSATSRRSRPWSQDGRRLEPSSGLLAAPGPVESEHLPDQSAAVGADRRWGVAIHVAVASSRLFALVRVRCQDGPLALPAAVRYATVRGGGRVAFRAVGTRGPSLVYIGGSASHQDLLWEEPGFRHLYGGLGDIARVLTIDRRGTGLSDPLPADASVETHVADIEAVLDAEGLTAASLSGTSDAARVAVAFAARHPDRVERLILFGSSASAGHQLEPARVAALRRLIETAWGEGRVIAMWAPSRLGDARFQAWAQRYERGCASAGQALKMIDLALSIDVSNDLARVAAPTLVMHRCDELLTPIADGRELAARIPGAIFCELPGTDAFTFSEDPELIRDEIATFIVGHRTSSRRARVFLAVLFTDIVGSTQLASRLGDERWTGLLQAWEEAARHAVDAAAGTWVKSTGDGALATFASTDAALECGIQLVQTSRRLGLQVRTGVHAGQCEQRGDGDVGGIAVHVAARIADRAGDGKVLTSGTVRDLVMGSDWNFAGRGEHELAGVAGSWMLYELANQHDAPQSPQSN